MAARTSARISIFVNASPLLPKLLKAKSEAYGDESRLPWLVTVPHEPAERSETDHLLVSLGLPSLQDVAPTQYDTLTESRAASVRRCLLYGTLYERLNAAYVLHLHILEAPQSTGALAPATLDALCVAALSRVYVAPPDEDTPRPQMSDAQLHGVLATQLRVLPPRSSHENAFRAAMSLLQNLALDTVGHVVYKLSRREDGGAAASAALRRVCQLKLHTHTLLFARSDHELNLAFPERAQHRRCVALLVLRKIVYASKVVQPRPKELDKLLCDACPVALEALVDPGSGHLLRAAAACLLGCVADQLHEKVQALAAGAMQHLVAIYSAPNLYAPEARAQALTAAGNISFGARDAAMIAPHTSYLFAQLQRFASQPGLLGERPTDVSCLEAVDLLYQVLIALSQISPYVQFRPLFENAANAEALEAVMRALSERPHTQHIRDFAAQEVLLTLMEPPEQLDITAVYDTVHVRGGKPAAAPEAVGSRCNGCAARGERFKICSACRTVHYCSRECQSAHWKQHKQACRAAVAAQQHVRLVTEIGLPASEATLEEKLEEIAAKLDEHAQATKPDTPE